VRREQHGAAVGEVPYGLLRQFVGPARRVRRARHVAADVDRELVDRRRDRRARAREHRGVHRVRVDDGADLGEGAVRREVQRALAARLAATVQHGARGVEHDEVVGGHRAVVEPGRRDDDRVAVAGRDVARGAGREAEREHLPRRGENLVAHAHLPRNARQPPAGSPGAAYGSAC
jgi:hypothetical protein